MQLPNTLKTASFLQKVQWITNPIKYMEKAAQKYPDIFTADIVGFGDTVVFISHPQAIQEIFSKDNKQFVPLGKLNRTVQPLIGDYSIFMLDGDLHKHRRQMMIPQFHGDRMKSYGQIIYKITEQVFNKLPMHKPFLARSVMQEISMQVILQAIFGLSEGERHQQIKRLLECQLNVFHSPLTSSFLLLPSLQRDLGIWSPWGKFVRQRQELDKLLYAEIAERRKKSDPDRIDILSLLISARDEAGQQMTDKQLRDELMALMIAGHETTATAMAWGLYWIHHLPIVHKKLLQELDTFGDKQDLMSIVKLPYLGAVCNETLRINPVAMLSLSRIVQEPVEILGHTLYPDTVVINCIYLVHQREDLYPQPKQFKPDRFLERQFSPYEFIPFGGGARRCIGDAFALFQMKLVLAKILSSYQLELANQQPEKPQRRGVTLSPANGVKMVITGRRARQEYPPMIATTSAS